MKKLINSDCLRIHNCPCCSVTSTNVYVVHTETTTPNWIYSIYQEAHPGMWPYIFRQQLPYIIWDTFIIRFHTMRKATRGQGVVLRNNHPHKLSSITYSFRYVMSLLSVKDMWRNNDINWLNWRAIITFSLHCFSIWTDRKLPTLTI